MPDLPMYIVPFGFSFPETFLSGTRVIREKYLSSSEAAVMVRLSGVSPVTTRYFDPGSRTNFFPPLQEAALMAIAARSSRYASL